MGERGLGIRSGATKQGWEKSDFPILCDTCLGENPYVRMTKSEFARECKTCQRPFTVFRWKPGNACRYKKTEICQTCAKVKNVCQTCLFDLDFGLPVELRDKFLDKNELVAMPKDAINRDFWTNSVNQDIEKMELPYQNPEVKQALAQMSRSFLPSYKRNQAHVCSFYVKGECNRGKACPYRHTNISEEDLESMKKGQGSIDERIRNRFHGVNDPVAKKILDRVKETNIPSPPEDMNITTIFIGGVNDDSINEETLKEQLESFGKIKGVKLIHKQGCAFVCFHARESAEKAVEAIFDRFFVNNKRLKVLWAKAQLEQNGEKPRHKPHHQQNSNFRGGMNKHTGQKREVQEDGDEEEVKQPPVHDQVQQQNFITSEPMSQRQASEQIKKLGITQNEQLKKLMFNYADDDEQQSNTKSVQYPSMLGKTTDAGIVNKQ